MALSTTSKLFINFFSKLKLIKKGLFEQGWNATWLQWNRVCIYCIQSKLFLGVGFAHNSNSNCKTWTSASTFSSSMAVPSVLFLQDLLCPRPYFPLPFSKRQSISSNILLGVKLCLPLWLISNYSASLYRILVLGMRNNSEEHCISTACHPVTYLPSPSKLSGPANWAQFPKFPAYVRRCSFADLTGLDNWDDFPIALQTSG